MDERAVEPVEIEISRSPRRVTHIGVRRIIDARLFDSLTPEMIKAAEMIRVGFNGITGGLHVKTWTVERVDNSHGSIRDYVQDCITWWWRWDHEMQRYKQPIAPVIDVFIEGRSCREVDRMRRKRHGWTKDKIDEGLRMYCRVRGWA